MMNTSEFFENFYQWLDTSPLSAFKASIINSINAATEQQKNGNLKKWMEAFNALPSIETASIQIDQSVLTLTPKIPLSTHQKNELKSCLKNLCPWKKGPFDFFSILIDAEWRSDWKWERIAPHMSSLKGKHVLDVGCGSGYHLWRILGSGASRVVGIDPSILFMVQFQAFKHYAGNHLPVDFLPVRMENFPQHTQAFDTVLSMGVLYHRKSPIDHLESLYHTLSAGGELVLETLVVDGNVKTVFMPEDRYAMMRNVWFIPSVDQLQLWLKRSGFKNTRLVDLNKTRLDEQRATEWMTNFSLSNFLDPENPDKTIEGYPAPLRATIIANK